MVMPSYSLNLWSVFERTRSGGFVHNDTVVQFISALGFRMRARRRELTDPVAFLVPGREHACVGCMTMALI